MSTCSACPDRQAEPALTDPAANIGVKDGDNEGNSPGDEEGQNVACTTDLLLRLETHQITEDQLTVEVKGIYNNLFIIEQKCIEVDTQQLNCGSELAPEQYKALISIHQTLMHEHYDFFLTSGHPSATEHPRTLASEYVQTLTAANVLRSKHLSVSINIIPTMNTKPTSRKRPADTPLVKAEERPIKRKTRNITAYHRSFQQHLIDHDIYPRSYYYPNGEKLPKPNNWDEIHRRLVRPRRSLSPSRFSEANFDRFDLLDTVAAEERPVANMVIPIIEGDARNAGCNGDEHLFSNLAPLINGTLSNAKPDCALGSRPEELHREIRKELRDKIVPISGPGPIIPNFFLKVKGPDGSLAVAARQACYNGALGARGIHCLQTYKQKPTYDGNTYTFTSTYLGGTLKLYTTHMIPPDSRSRGRPRYVMSQVKGWLMTSDSETFRKGATAYRNARDWAKEQRTAFIESANARYKQSLLDADSTIIKMEDLYTKSPDEPRPRETIESSKRPSDACDQDGRQAKRPRTSRDTSRRSVSK